MNGISVVSNSVFMHLIYRVFIFITKKCMVYELHSISLYTKVHTFGNA